MNQVNNTYTPTLEKMTNLDLEPMDSYYSPSSRSLNGPHKVQSAIMHHLKFKLVTIHTYIHK